MRKVSIAAILILTVTHIVAQSSPFLQGNCNGVGRSFGDWIHQTNLSAGQPYRVAAAQKARLLAQYSKIKLQMSLEEVEELLGTPDFTLTSLRTSPGPSTSQCRHQIVYVVEKNSDNMLDMADAAVYLSFSGDRKLYWTSPQNLPGLVPLGAPNGVTSIQGSSSSWKEYAFSDDGFAIMFPETPSLHLDMQLPDVTVYTVSPQPGAKLSLRVSHQDMDCAANLTRLKDHSPKSDAGADPSSVKDISIDGFPGIEYQYRLSSESSSYDRYYCARGKFYIFSSGWSGSQTMPANIKRIIDSFHLLNK